MATLRVSSESEVVELVREARETRRTLEIVGHGTKCGFGRPVECEDVLDLSGLSGIVSYEPDEMIVTARAGTPVCEIEAALAEHNQRLGFEPADWGPLFGAPANSATIGGVISASCDGSAAVRYGRARDHLLGFRAVNGFGDAYKGGGKVVKNVTGFDLPKLFCGAMGILGPLTEVTLRVFPKGEPSAVFAIRGLDPDEGLTLLRQIWRSPLEATAISLLPKRLSSYFPALPAMGLGTVNGCCALLRFDGSAASLATKRDLLGGIVKDHAISPVADGERDVRSASAAACFGSNLEDIWLAHVAPTAASDTIANIEGDWIADWAGTRIWIRNTPGMAAGWPDWCRRFGGSAVLIRASSETRQRIPPFASEDQVRAELTQRVKAAFDPLRLFNPGRMWEGV